MSGDVQAVRQERAKAVVNAIATSTSGDGSSTGTTQSADANMAASTAVSQNGTSKAPPGAATTGSAETNLSSAERVRFVQRVEQAFQDASDSGGSVRLRLSPPDLGSLRIEIKVSKGEMTARVEADTPAARNLILDNLPALRDRLVQHDIKVQRFDVDLMDRSGGGTTNQSSQQQNAPSQNPAVAPLRKPSQGGSTMAAVETSASGPASEEGRLNVVV